MPPNIVDGIFAARFLLLWPPEGAALPRLDSQTYNFGILLSTKGESFSKIFLTQKTIGRFCYHFAWQMHFFRKREEF